MGNMCTKTSGMQLLVNRCLARKSKDPFVRALVIIGHVLKKTSSVFFMFLGTGWQLQSMLCVDDDDERNKFFAYKNYPCLFTLNKAIQTVTIKTVLFLTSKLPIYVSQAV